MSSLFCDIWQFSRTDGNTLQPILLNTVVIDAVDVALVVVVDVDVVVLVNVIVLVADAVDIKFSMLLSIYGSLSTGGHLLDFWLNNLKTFREIVFNAQVL